jgi:hypothetical protein
VLLIVVSVRRLFLVVLLDAGVLVVEVERGGDALGHDAGAHPSRGSAGDAALEDQLDFLGTTEIEIFADHLFEEDAAVQQGLGSVRTRLAESRCRSGSPRVDPRR